MSIFKKIYHFISSMRFAILLLVILALACTAGSFVTQQQTYQWYASRYSERTAALIFALHLDDAFHSWWFVAINAFLCLNLLLCNVLRLPRLVHRTRAEAAPERALRCAPGIAIEGVASPETVFRKLDMPEPKPARTDDGREALFSSRHRVGLWGAWVCHLGILLLILGFSLGQFTKQEYTVYGMPGQSRAIGDTGLILTIDDFNVNLRDDDTVEQYTAAITVVDPSDPNKTREQSATISVNHPATLFGLRFYQNSTGWGADMHIAKDGTPLQEEVVCAGDYVRVSDKQDLVIFLNAFYPDYVLTPGSMPSTASGRLNNPAYLYSVYYRDQLLGMNALMQDETLSIDEYEVTFSNPRNYTLIQIKKDSFTWLALIGGLVTLLGLVLAFYVQPAKVWAVRAESGAWTMYGHCPKGGAIFKERFRRAAGGEKPAKTSEDNDHASN